jgi:hypothetical protein
MDFNPKKKKCQTVKEVVSGKSQVRVGEWAHLYNPKTLLFYSWTKNTPSVTDDEKLIGQIAAGDIGSFGKRFELKLVIRSGQMLTICPHLNFRSPIPSLFEPSITYSNCP